MKSRTRSTTISLLFIAVIVTVVAVFWSTIPKEREEVYLNLLYIDNIQFGTTDNVKDRLEVTIRNMGSTATMDMLYLTYPNATVRACSLNGTVLNSGSTHIFAIRLYGNSSRPYWQFSKAYGIKAVTSKGFSVGGAFNSPPVYKQPSWHLLFLEGSDLFEPYGNLVLTAHSYSFIGKAKGLPSDSFRYSCIVREDNGDTWIYGWRFDEYWKVLRAHTVDGFNFDHVEVTEVKPKEDWLGFADITYDAVNKRFLALNSARKYEEKYYPIYAYTSTNGLNWTRLQETPVYCDHDSFGLMWDALSNQFICYQTTHQAWAKKYEDNLGKGTRRVLQIRTSVDGTTWDPSYDFLGSGNVSSVRIIVPEKEDPEELEFYGMKAFPYGGRYLAMVLNYAPSPQVVNPRYPATTHAPQLSCEWWVSDDGMHWERPYRNFASADMPGPIPHEPMYYNYKLLFVTDNRNIYGYDVDRITSVYCLANGEFSTKPFVMPGPLFLNVDASFKNGTMHQQAYVMAELQDANGNVVKGYEKEKCAFINVNSLELPLKWEGKDGSELVGQNVRLRLYFRDTHIYAVTTGYPD